VNYNIREQIKITEWISFSSDQGSGALTVACDRHVSGLQLQEDGSFGAIGDQVALSRRMDDILMADIEVPAVPLHFFGWALLTRI
jgi:hypothetical protein